jgi:ribosome biogenesis protein ERB1
MAIHPLGDNIIVGTHDRRVCWFDLDLDNKPYKTFRYHEAGVNSCDFHRRYPLFASCSEDGTIHIFHATVYSDLMQNALIVPLKILKTAGKNKSIADIKFHPT